MGPTFCFIKTWVSGCYGYSHVMQHLDMSFFSFYKLNLNSNLAACSILMSILCGHYAKKIKFSTKLAAFCNSII